MQPKRIHIKYWIFPLMLLMIKSSKDLENCLRNIIQIEIKNLKQQNSIQRLLQLTKLSPILKQSKNILMKSREINTNRAINIITKEDLVVKVFTKAAVQLNKQITKRSGMNYSKRSINRAIPTTIIIKSVITHPLLVPNLDGLRTNSFHYLVVALVNFWCMVLLFSSL